MTNTRATKEMVVHNWMVMVDDGECRVGDEEERKNWREVQEMQKHLVLRKTVRPPPTVPCLSE